MMKKLFFALLLAAAAVACDKYEDFDVDTPSFNIEPITRDYHAGDTVRFAFSGDADMITFYSGERGELRLSFSTQCRYGGYLRYITVLGSTDFSGDYTEEGIGYATWTDLSDLFVFGTSTTLVSSGTKPIHHLIKEGMPLYLAVRYAAPGGPIAPQTSLSTWWVQDMKAEFAVPGAVTTVMSQVETEWHFVNFAANPPAAVWEWNADGKRINFNGNGVSTPAEGWAIADPLDPDGFAIGGKSIKNYIDLPLEGYEYVFHDPGTYEVVFEATNASAKQSKRVTRSMNITINP